VSELLPSASDIEDLDAAVIGARRAVDVPRIGRVGGLLRLLPRVGRVDEDVVLVLGAMAVDRTEDALPPLAAGVLRLGAVDIEAVGGTFSKFFNREAIRPVPF